MALPILDGNQSATTLSTILSGGEHTPAHTVVSLGSTAISNITSAVSGSVVSISNFPASQTIAGTVTANVVGLDQIDGETKRSLPVVAWNVNVADDPALGNVVPVQITNISGGAIGSGNPLSISGTVTVGNATTASAVAVRLIAEDTNPGGSPAGVNVNLYSNDNALLVDALKNGSSVLGYDGFSSYVQVKTAVGSSVTIGSLPAVSGTVTVGAMPNGSLTTRFGSVTTANTAQITSAVTKTSRKYLLAQNISTGTVTIGIGFSPTTTQGIQLAAGAGLTFDSFVPTGAVYWLGATTGAAYTILEG